MEANISFQKNDDTVVNRSHRSQPVRETASRANLRNAKLTTAVNGTVVSRSQSSDNDAIDYGDPENDYGTDYGDNFANEPVEPVDKKTDYGDYGDYTNGKILPLHKIPTVVRCETRFNSQMSETHEPDETLTTDEVGNSWCEHCDDHRKLMDLGHEKDWPAIIFEVHGGKVKLSSGQEKYFKFARTSGHLLVTAAVAQLESMKDPK
jgi:hypothetical protein